MHDQDATITVIDDGEGMDQEGLKQHWIIGKSNKRELPALPRGRQQIGKFGIGKLATYVLAERLTHISKSGKKYYSTSMDYRAIEQRVDQGFAPKTPIKIALHELTKPEAKRAVESWTKTAAFKKAGMSLFGRESPASWTVSVMSSLKPKVHEIKPGLLRWILRTALPLRPDFGIWLNGEKLVSSKVGKGFLNRWILGKDLIDLPRPAPKGVTIFKDKKAGPSSENRFGFDVPYLGRVTGYAEAYKDLLTGKSDEIGRSHGFFVYVYGRLLNVTDGHFGISPDELRHGTFGRFRLVVHMDGLDPRPSLEPGNNRRRPFAGNSAGLVPSDFQRGALYNRDTRRWRRTGREVGAQACCQPGQLVTPTDCRTVSGRCGRQKQIPLLDRP